MQHGFEGASMRMLTAKAGVNLAAVNYHFGSKHALIEAVFRRRLDPMNVARIAALDKLELIAGCKPEDRYDARLLEERLAAFLTAGLNAPLKNTIRKAA